MIVICKKASKKLVKGLRYDVQNLWNDGKNQRWLEGKVEIKGFGRYTVKNFTDIDGKPLPNVNVLNPRTVTKILEFSELKKGDILICTSDNYKTLVKGGMYRIESLKEVNQTYKSYSGQNFTRSEKTIKFEGIKRTLKFSSWRFRKLSANESREISLNSILTGEKPNILTSKIRKIDFVPNKNVELMNVVSKSIIDPNRHQLSILEWACQKTGCSLDINQKDFDELLGMNLGQILDLLDKS